MVYKASSCKHSCPVTDPLVDCCCRSLEWFMTEWCLCRSFWKQVEYSCLRLFLLNMSFIFSFPFRYCELDVGQTWNTDTTQPLFLPVRVSWAKNVRSDSKDEEFLTTWKSELAKKLLTLNGAGGCESFPCEVESSCRDAKQSADRISRSEWVLAVPWVERGCIPPRK